MALVNRQGSRTRGQLVPFAGAAIGVAVLSLVACGSSTSDSSGVDESSGSSEASVTVVAAESFCTPTGIDDLYTGDGHVTFFVTLRNDGGSDATVSVTPVRHYDDGEINESAMDAMSADVPAYETSYKFKSTAMKYKAHEHEIVECGLIVDGGNEVSIGVE